MALLGQRGDWPRTIPKLFRGWLVLRANNALCEGTANRERGQFLKSCNCCATLCVGRRSGREEQKRASQ